MPIYSELEIKTLANEAGKNPFNLLLAQIACGVDSNISEPILTAGQGYIEEAVKNVCEAQTEKAEIEPNVITKHLVAQAQVKLAQYTEAHI